MIWINFWTGWQLLSFFSVVEQRGFQYGKLTLKYGGKGTQVKQCEYCGNNTEQNIIQQGYECITSVEWQKYPIKLLNSPDIFYPSILISN